MTQLMNKSKQLTKDLKVMEFREKHELNDKQKEIMTR